MKKCNTVVRCHIKNEERLSTLERLIVSWKDKQLNKLGDLYLLDDHSPLKGDVVKLATKHNVFYKEAAGYGDTKNGLVESLKLFPNEPVLCCVDDMVFGKGSLERFEHFLNIEEPVIGPYGMFGFFACYTDQTRNLLQTPGEDYWCIPNNIIYALVCHIFSPQLSQILINEWEGIKNESIPNPCCCDDIWVARICERENVTNFNTMQDYGQHTGMMNRTFNEAQDPGSNYTSPNFIGE
jgi:hypothetical protein